MQRKIDYGLVGMAVTLSILLLGGWLWNAVTQANATSPIPTVISPTAISSTPLPIVSPTEISSTNPPPSPTKSSSTPYNLPLETDDPFEVIAALQYLADVEKERFLNKEGWYYLQSSSHWPGSSDTIRTLNEDDELIVLNDMSSADPLSEFYLLYEKDGQVSTGISFTRDRVSREIIQLSIVEGDSWVNKTLREAGFREEQYRHPLVDNYPTQNVLKSISEAYAYYQGKSSLWAYQQENLFYIHHRWPHPEPTMFAGASGLWDASESIDVFDMTTGQLVSSEITGYLAESGEPERGTRSRILKQEILSELPSDVADLYQP